MTRRVLCSCVEKRRVQFGCPTHDVKGDIVIRLKTSLKTLADTMARVYTVEKGEEK